MKAVEKSNTRRAYPASELRGQFRLPSRIDCLESAGRIPKTRPAWAGEEGPVTHITVAAGLIRIWDRDLNRWEQRLERVEQARQKQITAAAAQIGQGLGCDTSGMDGGSRGRITGWSAKSRNAMRIAFAEADWSVLFDGSRVPAMLTLTLPHDWVPLAPTAADFAKIVDRWQTRWERAWGERPSGGWKFETQGRAACVAGECNPDTRPDVDHDPRAPHVHILTAIPDGAPAGRTLSVESGEPVTDFASWLAASWVRACRTEQVLGHDAAVMHEHAGTGVDVDETLRYGDPARMAIYFAKHGLFEAKAYQNEPPASWRVEDLGGKRMWGLWGIVKHEKARATVLADPKVADKVARELRKLERKKGVMVTREVWRSRELPADMRARLDELLKDLDDLGNPDSPGALEYPWTDINALIGLQFGEDPRWRRVWPDDRGTVRLWSKRKTRRKLTRMPRTRGFLLVNDGPAVGYLVADWVRYFGSGLGLLDRRPDGSIVGALSADAARVPIPAL